MAKAKTKKKKSTTATQQLSFPPEPDLPQRFPSSSQFEELIKWSDAEVDKRREERRKSERIQEQIEESSGTMPEWYWEDFGEEDDEDKDMYDNTAKNAIDAEAWGSWDERDLLPDKDDPMEMGEWDPKLHPDFDPNLLDPNYEYVTEVPTDEDGVELNYDPIHGPAYTIDTRTILNPEESYMIDEKTRNDTMLEPDFDTDDVEFGFNEEFKKFRKSLRIVETYVDEFTKLEHPRYTARWYGYPEVTSFPPKPFMNNRFTAPENKTDFTQLPPFRARKKAVELARATNNEWLPEGKSLTYQNKKTKEFAKRGLLVGTVRKGECDEEIVERIQPALKILGNVADLLSIMEGDMEGKLTVFRFHYHGLIKNKRGMEAWTKVLIENCGVDCTGVVFETGRRKRDPWYDGGSHWF